jgi:hypothetical protein
VEAFAELTTPRGDHVLVRDPGASDEARTRAALGRASSSASPEEDAAVEVPAASPVVRYDDEQGRETV